MAPRPRRRPAHSATPGESHAKRNKKSNNTATEESEAIIERAARLGVTPERVLQEYARIAFADLRRFAVWGPEGLVLKEPGSLSDEDAAAISEITAAGTKSGGYRLKLYDKKAALDAIARHLGMFVSARRRHEDDPDIVDAEDAREVLARRLARLAAGSIEK